MRVTIWSARFASSARLRSGLSLRVEDTSYFPCDP